MLESALALRPQAKVWLTGIRGDETAERGNLDIFSVDRRGLLKVAPFYHSSQADISNYLRMRGLPSNFDYYDPTKRSDSSECGLHT